MDNNILDFLITAKRHSYAGHGSEIMPYRPNSHDLKYEKDNMMYYDTYLGGKVFHGQEAVWQDNIAIWAMNYSGQTLNEKGFSLDFLKEALYNVPSDMPFRGPKLFKKDDYIYKCTAVGDTDWFSGDEKILYKGELIYECRFHGGKII